MPPAPAQFAVAGSTAATTGGRMLAKGETASGGGAGRWQAARLAQTAATVAMAGASGRDRGHGWRKRRRRRAQPREVSAFPV